MLKKAGMLGIISLGVATPSFGSNEFYVGIGAGPEHANFRQSATITKNTVFTVSNFSADDKTHFAGKGGFASLFVGYAYRFPGCANVCENYYLGLEANANYRRVRFKFYNNEYTHLTFNHTFYKMDRDLGISLLPGLLFTDCTLFYGRLGYANGKFKSDTTDTSLENLHKKRGGFRYGLGFRQSLSDCIAFRIEYSQTSYKKIRMFTFDPGGVVTKYTSLAPKTQRFELGVMYTF